MLFLVSLMFFLSGAYYSEAHAKTKKFHFDGFEPIEAKILKNGTQVYIWPDTSAQQVSLEIWYRAGSIHEKPGVTGIAHLFEHMMLRPSRFAPKGALAFERTMGADVGAHTRYRTTNYNITFPQEKLDFALNYQADVMKNLPLNEEMLSKEKEAVRSEYLIWDNNPMMKLLPELAKRAYSSHIAENFITGARADLDKISLQDCKDFYQKYYAPNNAILVLTGNLNPKDTFHKVEQIFGVIKEGNPSAFPADISNPPQSVSIEKPVPGSSSPLVLTYSLPFQPLKFPQDSHIKLAFDILFEGNDSLVGEKLVHQEKLASDISYEEQGLGFSFVSISLLKKDSAKALKIVDDIVTNFQNLEEKRFFSYAKNTQSNLLRNLQSPAQRAFAIGYYVTHRNGMESLQLDLELAKKINLSELKKTVKNHLKNQNRIAVLGMPNGANR